MMYNNNNTVVEMDSFILLNSPTDDAVVTFITWHNCYYKMKCVWVYINNVTLFNGISKRIIF